MGQSSKIAVLSDIHGNLQAFEAVLQAVQDADQILLLGDNVNWGVQGPEVLNLIQQKQLVTVYGNHEVMLLQHLQGTAPDEHYTSASFAPARFWADQMKGWESTLMAWPLTHLLQVTGLPEVLLCHASPRSAFDEVLSMTDTEFSGMLSEHPFGLFLAGHTHRQSKTILNHQTFCNVGSVGFSVEASEQPHAAFVILEGQNGTWDIQFKQIPFDHAGFFDTYHQSGFLSSTGIMGQILYVGALLGRSTIREFWRYKRTYRPEADFDEVLLHDHLHHELTLKEKWTLRHHPFVTKDVQDILKSKLHVLL